ncbi:MAG: V-type ATPase 116kDa subunit family protein [bacterium]|nr:V-type ATPase 116kDa subunit family protein [bacterium]
MIVAMAKALIIGPKALQPRVIKTLQTMGRVHLSGLDWDRHNLKSYALSPDQQTRKLWLEKVSSDIDQFLVLTGFRGKPAAPTDPDWDGLPAMITEFQQKAKALAKEKMELEDELSLVESYRGAYQALAQLMIKLEKSHKIKAFGFLLKGGDVKIVKMLAFQLGKITAGKCEVYSQPLEDGRMAALAAYHVSDSDKIKAFFAKAGISQLKLPAAMESLPMTRVLAMLKEKSQGLPRRIAEIVQEMDELSRASGPKLLGYRELMADELSRFGASVQTGQGSLTFVVQGYLPQSQAEELRTLLEKEYLDQVTVQIVEIDHHQAAKVPVILKNRSLIKPFELLLSIFNPPRYGTVDPTPFIAFFFPLFFGFIVGDIGYGILMLIASILVRIKLKNNDLAKSLATIFMFCAVWTTLFGILFGELFGDYGEHMHWIKPMAENLNRLNSESIMTLFTMALFIGVVHVYVGFGIMLYIGIKQRNLHHILEPVAFALGVLGVFGTFFTLMVKMLPASLMWPSIILTGAGAVALGVLAGVAGPIEIFGAVGNILSYARLFAIGLSAAYLAYAANLIGRTIGGLPGFLVAALVIHPVFFVLGLISPIMQPFRLQVVEFLTKFKYHDYPGKQYKPLKTIGGK